MNNLILMFFTVSGVITWCFLGLFGIIELFDKVISKTLRLCKVLNVFRKYCFDYANCNLHEKYKRDKFPRTKCDS